MSTTSAQHQKTIDYFVNNEVQYTQEHELPVRVILGNAGFTPVEEYRLMRLDGHHTFEDLDELVPLHEGEKFAAIFRGPTPVS